MILKTGCPRSRYWLGWFLLKPLSLACRWLCAHCVLTWIFSLCMHIPGIFSFSHKDNSIALGPHIKTILLYSSNLFNFLKALSFPNMVILGATDSTYELGGQNSVHNIISFHSSLNVIFIVDYSMILTIRINVSLLWSPITCYKYLCLELISLLFFWIWKPPGWSLPLVLLSFYLSQFVNLSKWTY